MPEIDASIKKLEADSGLRARARKEVAGMARSYGVRADSDCAHAHEKNTYW